MSESIRFCAIFLVFLKRYFWTGIVLKATKGPQLHILPKTLLKPTFSKTPTNSPTNDFFRQCENFFWQRIVIISIISLLCAKTFTNRFFYNIMGPPCEIFWHWDNFITSTAIQRVKFSYIFNSFSLVSSWEARTSVLWQTQTTIWPIFRCFCDFGLSWIIVATSFGSIRTHILCNRKIREKPITWGEATKHEALDHKKSLMYGIQSQF